MVDERPRKTRMELRYDALRRDGFSDFEAYEYRKRKIDTKNVLWIRRARRRFMTGLTEDERESFLVQMDERYSRMTELADEEGSKIYSPDLPEDREGMVEFWEEQLEVSRVPVK